MINQFSRVTAILVQVREFFRLLGSSIASLLKVLLISKPTRFYDLSEKKSKDCVILGNGPSLQAALEKHREFLVGKDLFVVNFFWKSSFFEELKPRHYFIFSESYFFRNNKEDNNREGREATFKELSQRVTWEMNLYVPVFARAQTTWAQPLVNHRFIKIWYINTTPLSGFRGLLHFLMSKGLGMPRPHNIIVPSLKTAIDYRYNNIYVLGIDHSWLKEINVSDNNEVMLKQVHFYDRTPVQKEPMYKGLKTEKRNMAEVLIKFIHTFESYYAMRSYADSKNCRIYNATEGSFVDAFERFRIP